VSGSGGGGGLRSRSALRRPVRLWLALGMAVLPGCYRYLPPQATPEPGERVRIELNDLGRLRMADSLGPEAGRVEGVLESKSDSLVVLRVAQVWGEYGGLAKWDGERVSFRQEYIRDMRERRFSPTRTVIVAVAVTAGLVTFVVTRNFLGFGSVFGGGGGGGGGGSGGTQ
jgi:hypothetical protein